ncbi:glycosyltransferase family 4 protein [Agrococcus jejuensis]|uniref:Glycosyl transferases group 1 n=1 Tax=Agrococcus jejuensis TaxID=399736 RepID=A0A1G8FGU0_9MICO|nr:glycosyltransferase family 4 protein [Agrococcus jejuensis]SDH81364.1 Glycosyl transferases group 1 [Agrococcus jejuensis]
MPGRPPRRHAVTIVARNYTGQARVLARSFQEHHPDVGFSTLVIDGEERDRDLQGVGDVLLPVDIGLDPRELELMQTIYDVMELATALKPATLRMLLRGGARSAAYIDPDIRFYDAIDDVFEAAEREGIALTPHTLDPMPRDGRRLDERDIMVSGIYNLGFVCIGARALAATSWWHERLRTDAVVDLANALFTDQRWMDWAPSLFGHVILKDRGLNAAYWNVHERPIHRVDGVWHAGPDRLRFYHFSGYDPTRGWMLSKHMGDRPRTLLSAHPELHELCTAYGDELREVGHLETRTQAYGLDELPDGLRLDPVLRRLVRSTWIDAIARGDEWGGVPMPFSDPTAFRAWLSEPEIGDGPVRLSRAAHATWSVRVDLQAAFPDVLGRDAEAFSSWCQHDPATAERLRDIAQGQTPVATVEESLRRFGWSVVAYAASELGVGEAGRRVSASMRATGLPTELIATSFGSASRRKHVPRATVRRDRGFENVITCVNADQVAMLSDRLQLERIEGKHIGYWFWELAEFPEDAPGLTAVDEIWTATTFTRDAIAAVTDLPVHVAPLAIPVPDEPTSFTRRVLGMPDDRFVLLASFDYLSVPERKNPTAVIDAYVDAFGPDDGAALIVKSINGALQPDAAERVRAHARGRKDVLFVDGYLSSAQMLGMLELADCYVSLHRAEGYGLNLADAMARRTPVIATAYSGNMDFQTDETALLVPYELREVGRGADPYSPTAVWADPDVAAASAAMRRLFDDRSLQTSIAQRAIDDIRANHGLERSAATIASLLLGEETT